MYIFKKDSIKKKKEREFSDLYLYCGVYGKSRRSEHMNLIYLHTHTHTAPFFFYNGIWLIPKLRYIFPLNVHKKIAHPPISLSTCSPIHKMPQKNYQN